MNEHMLREGFSSYYVVPARSGDAFAERILKEQSCKAILPFEIRRVDEESCYYYDTSGLLSLKKKLQGTKSGKMDYQEIYQRIILAVREIESFLLPLEGIILDSEVILLGDDGQVYLCYCPGYERDVLEQLRMLTEEFLQEMDYQEEEVVSYMYQIHEQLMRGIFPEKMIMLEKQEEEKKEKEELITWPQAQVEIPASESPEEEAGIYSAKEGGRGKKWWIETAIFAFITAIATVLIVFYLVSGIMTGWSVRALRMLFLAALILIANIIYFLKKRRQIPSEDKQTTIFTP